MPLVQDVAIVHLTCAPGCLGVARRCLRERGQDQQGVVQLRELALVLAEQLGRFGPDVCDDKPRNIAEEQVPRQQARVLLLRGRGGGMHHREQQLLPAEAAPTKPLLGIRRRRLLDLLIESKPVELADPLPELCLRVGDEELALLGVRQVREGELQKGCCKLLGVVGVRLGDLDDLPLEDLPGHPRLGEQLAAPPDARTLLVGHGKLNLCLQVGGPPIQVDDGGVGSTLV
mmetsp:Transcript_93620/g.303029  ORF Transcript_93620/g.303029 Transcript_93620/m.303029 type:complete len:230 (+) Transcript_93620:1849-2538(+)